MKATYHLPQLLLSVSALIFAVATLILALRFGVTDLGAVAAARNGLKTRDTVYTQSEDGKTLYQWLWHSKDKQWKKETYAGSF